ncbi:hypothetical protein [Marivirga arenosa]|uniref:Uncharacterized protein n=1 Tax=Marivirga arenosa TaxID=3059076 RepID=A0AA49GCG7_9BACT|nr:hypothetical protein [Marivirga sp. BKB1-2]WKK81809.2 hypothetical protein QYS47_06200 [Marivirga sp. BKB1-2]
MMRNCSLLFLLFTIISFSSIGKDTYFRGFYNGENVFVRNPYLGQGAGFCIEAIYLNGQLLVKNPDVSAYQIDMQGLEVDSRVVIRIVHDDSCEPELTNPEVIEDLLEFNWLKFYVDENEIIWITTKESKEGFYIVEKQIDNEWMILDTVKTKGGIFINQHSVEADHSFGENLYRVQYHDLKLPVKYSETFNYKSDKREITYAITDDWMIEFSEEVSFWLYNANSRIIKRGKDVTCDIQKLPKGRYMLKYDGKEVYFDKE